VGNKLDNRTNEQIREHYEIERDLARQLMNAPWQERSHLASSLYDELYRRVPHHPQHTQKNSIESASNAVNSQMKFLSPFLHGCRTFLEVGPGDCALSLNVANKVAQVYAVDVSSEITKIRQAPANFQLLLTDGRNIPLKSNSVNIAYSNQLMEHLHPDDAIVQLKNIYAALAVGGKYVCITPSRLTGPHDVSKYYDEVATGFHLKEYSILELYKLFKEVGFSKVKAWIGLLGIYLPVPVPLLAFMEKIILRLPKNLRKPVARTVPFRVFLNMIRMVGIK
jgi:SAM-dependent methyltransferase